MTRGRASGRLPGVTNKSSRATFVGTDVRTEGPRRTAERPFTGVLEYETPTPKFFFFQLFKLPFRSGQKVDYRGSRQRLVGG